MKQEKQDFIIDFETIGQNAMKCPIVDAAFVVFDWDRFLTDPYTFEELTGMVQTAKFDVKAQCDNGCSFSKDDLAWWQGQSEEAKVNLKPSENDLTIQEFSAIIFKYLREVGKIEHWWSRGNTFDPVLIERVMNELGQHHLMNEYLKWWRVRDIRTWIDAKLNFPKKNGFIPVADIEYWNETFIGHDSTHDVSADIMRLQTLHRVEFDYEQPKR